LDIVETKFYLILKIDGESAHLTARASASRKDDISVDGGGQNETLVIVGVLTNEIDAPWSTPHNFRRCAEGFAKC
jgi:hypothetical protein